MKIEENVDYHPNLRVYKGVQSIDNFLQSKPLGLKIPLQTRASKWLMLTKPQH